MGNESDMHGSGDPTSGPSDLNAQRGMQTAQALANVDQLPVYGQFPAGAGIRADDLMPIVAREIAGETNKDLLLYIHVPFCKYKCSFCDWVADIPTSQLTSGPDLRRQYVDAMCRQVRHLGPKLMELGYTPRYIYWGGGTPSRLDGGQFRQIMDALASSVNLSSVDEHVMEVTPDSLEPSKLEAMKSIGVSRISMGVQSFDPGELRRSGRGHSPAEADRAVEMMRTAGFDNFNIDLIIAFPGQELGVLRDSLKRTLSHAPRHITAYIYRPTPATTMAKRRKRTPVTGQIAAHMSACYDLTRDMLEAAGYREYSLGYFSRDASDRCAGELYYFHLQGDWMGFGGGAVSVLGHHRLKISHSSLQRFIEDPLSFDGCEILPNRQVEAAIYALRQALATDMGINFENFRRFFGFSFNSIRRHPAVRAYLGYYRYCGAVFHETDTQLSMTRESRAKAYMNVWAKAESPAATAEALKHTTANHG